MNAAVVNRFRNPVADFSSRQAARKAACAVNDGLRRFTASYRRIDDRLWRVEASDVPLPEFLCLIEGCEGRYQNQ